MWPAVFVLLPAIAFGAELTGRVEQTSDIAIRVWNGNKLITVYTSRATEIVRGKSPAPGDEIRVEFHQDGKKIVADRVYPSITVSGTVTELNEHVFWIVTSPPQSQTRLVRIWRDTVFGTSRKHLEVDREVLVVGWDVGDGSIDAARIAIYGTDTPVTGTRLR